MGIKCVKPCTDDDSDESSVTEIQMGTSGSQTGSSSRANSELDDISLDSDSYNRQHITNNTAPVNRNTREESTAEGNNGDLNSAQSQGQFPYKHTSPTAEISEMDDISLDSDHDKQDTSRRARITNETTKGNDGPSSTSQAQERFVHAFTSMLQAMFSSLSPYGDVDEDSEYHQVQHSIIKLYQDLISEIAKSAPKEAEELLDKFRRTEFFSQLKSTMYHSMGDMSETDHTDTVLAEPVETSMCIQSQYVSHQIEAILDLEKEYHLSVSLPENRRMKKITGSMAEGFFSCRLFENNNYDWEMECDIMIEVAIFNKSECPCLSGYPGEDAYCYVKGKSQDADKFLYVAKPFEDMLTETGQIDPVKFKVNCLEMYSMSMSWDKAVATIRDSNPFLWSIMSILKSNAFLGNAGSTMTLSQDDLLQVGISIDEIPCIRLQFWPDVANYWINRDALWPMAEERESIASLGCHVVPKSPKHGEQDAWRYSFSIPEQKLMALLSKGQRRSFFLFKILFYRYIKPIGQIKNDEGKTETLFHSYLCKTVMLWYCEQHPPSHPIWEDTCLFASVGCLFRHLGEYLEQSFLPHFFIPEYNLIKDITSKFLKKVKTIVDKMRKDIQNLVPKDLETVSDILRMKSINTQFLMLFGGVLTTMHNGRTNPHQQPERRYSLN